MRVKFAHQVELGFAVRKGLHLKRGSAIRLTVRHAKEWQGAEKWEARSVSKAQETRDVS